MFPKRGVFEAMKVREKIISIASEFLDVFLKEIHGLLSVTIVEFTINTVP